MAPSTGIPRGVWMLGFVSLFMDVSSELIHSLLPVFMVTSLGATALMVGVVEGVAEATALIVKVFSGTISDWLGKRKGLTVLGYGLGALSKPVFALALTVHWVFVARFMDRIGKGIRGAPRDALIADLTPPEIRGAAYGLRQSLDTVGAFIGPLLAVGAHAVVGGGLSHGILVRSHTRRPVRAAPDIRRARAGRRQGRSRPASPVQWRTLGELGGAYWWVVVAGGVFTLARFSEAFLISEGPAARAARMPMRRWCW